MDLGYGDFYPPPYLMYIPPPDLDDVTKKGAKGDENYKGQQAKKRKRNGAKGKKTTLDEFEPLGGGKKKKSKKKGRKGDKDKDDETIA